MATAFQSNAFQNNAFQIDGGGGSPPPPPPIDPGTKAPWLRGRRPDEEESPKARSERIAREIDEAFNPQPEPPKRKTRKERRAEQFGRAPEPVNVDLTVPDDSELRAALEALRREQDATLSAWAAAAEREWRAAVEREQARVAAIQADDEIVVSLAWQRRRQLAMQALELLKERYGAKT